MNNIVANSIPMLALMLAQLDESGSKLLVYGPMGIICCWLMLRDELARRENSKVHAGVREDNEKLREEFRGFVHQLKGLNRNLLYVTATHGPAGLRDVAEKELERIHQRDYD